jgi:putative ABC transport system permease protein
LIVGVAADVKYLDLNATSEAEFYLPFLQSPQSSMALVVRGANPEALAGPVRNAIWTLDKSQPVDNVITMDQIIEQRLGKESALTNIISLFSITALLLAGFGIYGMTAFSVRQRTREIGIRIALGAQKGNILALVIKQSLLLILIGIVVGMAGAVLLGRAISSLLYGVQPVDPGAFALSSLILVIIGIAASYVPARKASQVDPAIAFKQE